MAQNDNIKLSIQDIEKQLPQARRAKDKTSLGKLLSDLFKICIDENENNKAILYINELIELYSRNNDQSKVADMLRIRAFVNNRLGLIDQAFEDIEESQAIFTSLSNTAGYIKAHVLKGTFCRFQGKHDEALSIFLEAMEYYTNLQDKGLLTDSSDQYLNYASVVESVGVIYGILNQMDKSREYLNKSLILMKNIHHQGGIIQALNNLGVSYSQEDPQKTLAYYKESLQVAEQINYHTMIIVLTNNIGGVYEDLGDYPNALKQYLEAQRLCDHHKNYRFMAEFLLHIGTVYKKMGQYDHAESFTMRSLEFANKFGKQKETQDAYQLLSEIEELKGNFKGALDHYKKYTEYHDKFFNDNIIEKLTSLQEKYDETNRELQETRRHKSLITDALKRNMNMNFIGCSRAIRDVMDLAMTAANHSETSVLITGESGTGKEIIAHIIHYASKRKDYLIVPVNCSAIPDGLVESEFFGHIKGAFTGALMNKTGYIEEANMGTLFLDEIADTPTALQAKLLRVLENKKIKQIGSNKEIKIDFRLIAATNKDIGGLIKQNVFRADLLYRINTIEINIPPLRERKDDIEPLLQYFIDEFARALKKKAPSYTPHLLDKLVDYHFPGNVRELRNMVEKAMIMFTGDVLDIDNFDLDQPEVEERPSGEVAFGTMAEMEKRLILEAMRRADNNQTNAAKLLGISYSTIQRKLRDIDANSR